MKAEDILFISLGGAAASIARRIAQGARRDLTQAPMRVLILDTDDAVLGKHAAQLGAAGCYIDVIDGSTLSLRLQNSYRSFNSDFGSMRFFGKRHIGAVAQPLFRHAKVDHDAVDERFAHRMSSRQRF